MFSSRSYYFNLINQKRLVFFLLLKSPYILPGTSIPNNLKDDFITLETAYDN